MSVTKNQDPNSKKSPSGFLNDALSRAKKVFESTTSKAEETGKKALKFTEEMAKTVSHQAEAAVKKIREMSQGEDATPEAKTKKPLSLKSKEGKSLEKELATVAEDIYSYLEKNGEASLDKIVNVMKRKKNTQLLVFCAIGWLLHDKKVIIGADDTTIAIKK
jgi:hypothetical protein